MVTNAQIVIMHEDEDRFTSTWISLENFQVVEIAGTAYLIPASYDQEHAKELLERKLSRKP